MADNTSVRWKPCLPPLPTSGIVSDLSRLATATAPLQTGLGPSVPLIELIQLLRDRGVIALKPLEDKVELAEFFCSPQLRGGSLSSMLQVGNRAFLCW